MKLPEKFSAQGKSYRLIKEYKYYGLYEEENTKYKICFDEFDLKTIQNIQKQDEILIILEA
ncbi:MAG: hypothetical protein HFJ45_01705 [Clostridia bacterium]|nr:hypothetical protein [Clostridia bacterium]